MSEWKECAFGDVAVLLYGKGLKESARIPGNTPVYGSNGIIGFHNEPLIKGPGVIIGRKGSVGEVRYSESDFYPIDTTYYLDLKSGNDIKFFYYNLLTLQLTDMNSHSAVPGLNRNDVYSLKIPLPPLPEQRAIASVLSSLDDKIDLLHRQNTTLEAMAEALFRQWFVEEADDGWEETTIENVCVRIASGGTPSTKVGEYYNGDINWYSTRELSDTFLYESSTKITNSGLENSSAKMFPENTVLIAIYAAPTVGRLGILANDATFNQAACGFIADENKICFEYLYLHLLFSRQKLNDIASGSAQQNLNVKIIKNFEILLPPANIVQKLKCVVRPIFQQIKLNTKQIMTLEKLRDTLLPKLMSGDVRVDYS